MAWHKKNDFLNLSKYRLISFYLSNLTKIITVITILLFFKIFAVYFFKIVEEFYLNKIVINTVLTKYYYSTKTKTIYTFYIVTNNYINMYINFPLPMRVYKYTTILIKQNLFYLTPCHNYFHLYFFYKNLYNFDIKTQTIFNVDNWLFIDFCHFNDEILLYRTKMQCISSMMRVFDLSNIYNTNYIMPYMYFYEKVPYYKHRDMISYHVMEVVIKFFDTLNVVL